MESPRPGSFLPTSDLELALSFRSAHDFPEVYLRGQMRAAQRSTLRGPGQTSSQWWELTSLPRHWVTRRPVCAVTPFQRDTPPPQGVLSEWFSGGGFELPVGEMALWADMISSSQLTLGIVFGPAVWANFERFLPYPFYSASGCAWFPAAWRPDDWEEGEARSPQ